MIPAIQHNKLIERLHRRDFVTLRNELIRYHEADIANFLGTLLPEESAIIFRLLPKETGAHTFAFLEREIQERLIQAFQDEEVAHLFNLLQTDDAVDFLEEVPANVVNRILRLSSAERRYTINQFLLFAPDCAGSVMTSEFIQLKQHMTVTEAIEHIRLFGRSADTIYTAYVTGDTRVLEGVISLRDLLLADDEAIIIDIMDREVIQVRTYQDQEFVLDLFREYAFITLPVVDEENRLVGIITHDDVLGIADEEATEDFEKMALIAPSYKPYLKTPVLEQARNRFGWLLILMISGMINGVILQHYESAFLILPLLVTFIPMLTDTGGNAGSQSSTMIIRGMALREISFQDFFRVMQKEIGIATLVGLALGSANFLRIFLQYDHQFLVAFTVSLSLFGIVLFAKIFGFALPLVAKRVGLDPAIMAAPLITTIVDTMGLILYFELASRLLLTS